MNGGGTKLIPFPTIQNDVLIETALKGRKLRKCRRCNFPFSTRLFRFPFHVYFKTKEKHKKHQNYVNRKPHFFRQLCSSSHCGLMLSEVYIFDFISNLNSQGRKMLSLLL